MEWWKGAKGRCAVAAGSDSQPMGWSNHAFGDISCMRTGSKEAIIRTIEISRTWK